MPESLVPFGANDRLPGMPRREAFAAEFFALLSERVARFTMGDSSSVRAETAEQIGRGEIQAVFVHQPAHGLAETQNIKFFLHLEIPFCWC